MKYPIRVVAKQTGISPATLRVWEKRYHGVVPERDTGGRRLYSESTLHRLRLIAALVNDGYRVSDVVDLDQEALEKAHADSVLSTGPETAPVSAPESQSSVRPSTSDPVTSAADAVVELDQPRLNRIMQEVLDSQGDLAMIDGFVFPTITRVEKRIHSGSAKPIHRSALESALHAFLYRRLPPLDAATSMPIVAVAVLPGQDGATGAVASMLHAAAVGWYPLMLGTHASPHELAEAAGTSGWQALLLSLVTDRADADLVAELATLADVTAGDPPILLGGRIPSSLQRTLEGLGLEYLENMGALRRSLATIMG